MFAPVKYQYFLYLFDGAEAGRCPFPWPFVRQLLVWKVACVAATRWLVRAANLRWRQCQEGRLAGAAHLLNDNTGVQSGAQREWRVKAWLIPISVQMWIVKSWLIDPLVFCRSKARCQKCYYRDNCMACGSQVFTAMLLFDPTMLALPIIVEHNSPCVGLFTHMSMLWDRLVVRQPMVQSYHPVD